MSFDQECHSRSFGVWNDFWPNRELATEAIASWDHCLHLDWYAPEPRERKWIQGVPWEITPEDIV